MLYIVIKKSSGDIPILSSLHTQQDNKRPNKTLVFKNSQLQTEFRPITNKFK